MATISEQRASLPDPTNSKGLLGSHGGGRRPNGRKRRWLAVSLVSLVLVGGITVAVFAAGALMGVDDAAQVLKHAVQRGDLVITVTEDGNMESASNRDLKCEVEKGSTILWIVEDGTRVKEGDTLVELDKSAIEDQLNQQKIVVEKAKATTIQAQVDVEVAEISIKEYLEGTYKQSIQDVEKQIRIAKEDLNSAKNTLDYTQRMMRKGYATPLQLDAQKFAVERAELELATAETAKYVLENFTKEKMLKDLQAQRDAAQARLRSEESALAAEENTLKRLQEQVNKCVIKAPQDGMVVYANERSRFGSQQDQITEGSAVRERQTILRVPDLAQMQVKVTVHESKVETLERGMPAVIRIQDRELKGQIVRIATQPEPGSWRSANVKEYATIVKIEGQPEGLKPGMTAEVEILINHLKDVISVPVQAVVEQRGSFYCWVFKPGGPERRPVVVGASNDKFIEIKDGLREEEEVLLNPRAMVAEAREEAPGEAEVDVEDTFGTDSTQPQTGTEEGSTPPGGRPGAALSGGPPERGESPRRGGGGGRGGFDPAQMFQRMDTDGDGKLTGDEISERMAGADTNGDGEITPEELQERMRQFRGGRGGFDPAQMFQRMDTDGDGKLTGDEIPERMGEADTNGDGEITLEELQERMRQFRGGGGGRGRRGGPGGGGARGNDAF